MPAGRKKMHFKCIMLYSYIPSAHNMRIASLADVTHICIVSIGKTTLYFVHFTYAEGGAYKCEYKCLYVL